MAVILSGTLGAISWDLMTWWRGLPSSSSHALVGGLVGAVLVETDSQHVVWGWSGLWDTGEWAGVTEIIAALLFSPLTGLLIGFVLLKLLRLLLRPARPTVNRPLRQLQWLGAAGLAFSHGTNDAQKSMGIITLVLVLTGQLDQFNLPDWVILSCAVSITIGTSLGGWRIVRTVGFGIYRLRPVHSLSSQLTAASVISAAAMVGGPVSTTHAVRSTATCPTPLTGWRMPRRNCMT